MLFILVLIIARIVPTGSLQTTLPVSIVLDGFTVESWNEQLIWNKTRTTIVQHLNSLCKKIDHCDAQYGTDNIHLLDVIQCGFSSICLNITADEPILNKLANTTEYNYTTLLSGALFQAKIDIEHLHDNQLLTTIISSSSSIPSDQNLVLNRTTRLLFVLLGITIVAIVFALTIVFFQRIHKYSYSRLLKSPRTYQHTQDELLSYSPCNS